MSNITIADWDYRKGKLVKDINSTDFANSSTVGLFGTPIPKYTQDAVDMAMAIGLIQSTNMSQGRQMIQISEIGSKGRYTMSTGRVAGSMTIQRVLYNGPNLLKILYGNIADDMPPATNVRDVAGYGKWLMNLGSTLFDRPLGLIMVFRDQGNTPVSAQFLVNAHIVSHGIGMNPDSPMIGEGVNISFDDVWPLQTGGQPDDIQAYPELG